MGLEGLCHILIVFRKILRPDRTTPSNRQPERAKEIEDAMEEVEKEKGLRGIEFGLRHTGGPKEV